MAGEEVDFLVVTALDVETVAVRRLLEDLRQLPHDVLGSVSREESPAKYSVALTEIGRMGTAAAQGAAMQALLRSKPKRVLLVGVAAGFPEAGIGYGDVMIPYAVVPYGLAKISESTPGVWPKRAWNWLLRKLHFGGLNVEHRGIAVAVSEPLWHAANTLAQQPEARWATGIAEARPDGLARAPTVHSAGYSVLGSGDEVISSEGAEQRKWLVKQYGRNAIGLEMEGWGVLSACHAREKPFLVVKASQDPATGEKDRAGLKDRWRRYAAEAAAAFAVAIIRRFQIPDTQLLSSYRQEAALLDRSYLRAAPQPPFNYTVSIAGTYSSLRRGIYEANSRDLAVLLPTADRPFIALHGGGGTGKTRIARTIFEKLLDEQVCPVFLDLKKASGQLLNKDPLRTITDIIVAASAPRCTPAELRLLAAQARVGVIIDGLNELSRESRTLLIDFFQSLHAEVGCYILVTVRHGLPDPLPRFVHAMVDRLEPALVQRVFDGTFGVGSFGRLDARLREIYLRPFFLSLAVRTGRQYEGKHVWSGIFEEFFLSQLGLTEERVDLIASATFGALGESGSVDIAALRASLGGEFATLVASEVLTSDESGFEHELWRDYLLSRYLARDPDKWTDKWFDAATTFASSIECLPLTVEQLATAAARDALLKAVYDWNYVAAADCIRELRTDEPAPRQLSLGIRVAILAAIAEKRFDAVQRTRVRAEDILRGHSDDFARPLILAESRGRLVQHVAGLMSPEPWYAQWKELFIRPDGQALSPGETAAVSSGDSLIGWTAANAIRRGTVDEQQLEWLRDAYRQNRAADTNKTVRWRIVHVLGAFPTEANAAQLLEALTADPYHWVKYGAARALVETAANAGDALAMSVLSTLQDAVTNLGQHQLWMRRQILREAIETAFIRGAAPGWRNKVTSLLELAVAQSDLQYREELNLRLNAFRNTNDWE